MPPGSGTTTSTLTGATDGKSSMHAYPHPAKKLAHSARRGVSAKAFFGMVRFQQPGASLAVMSLLCSCTLLCFVAFIVSHALDLESSDETPHRGQRPHTEVRDSALATRGPNSGPVINVPPTMHAIRSAASLARSLTPAAMSRTCPRAPLFLVTLQSCFCARGARTVRLCVF